MKDKVKQSLSVRLASPPLRYRVGVKTKFGITTPSTVILAVLSLSKITLNSFLWLSSVCRNEGFAKPLSMAGN